MPKGPKGEKRPADVIGAAVLAALASCSPLAPAPERLGGLVFAGVVG